MESRSLQVIVNLRRIEVKRLSVKNAMVATVSGCTGSLSWARTTASWHKSNNGTSKEGVQLWSFSESCRNCPMFSKSVHIVFAVRVAVSLDDHRLR